MIDMNLMGQGAVERPWDIRNISYSAFFPDTGDNADVFDWNVGFDLSQEVPFIIKNQDGSSSCVGQGWSYYAEALNFKETGIFTPLSPKFIYSRIFLPGGGAYGNKTMNAMAQAIRNQYGMCGGITGSNQGVSLPSGIIRPPLPGEALWGHWLFFCA